GVANIQAFVNAGGLFITVADNASLPIDFGITTGVTIQDARQFQARGSVLNTIFADRRSPIAYGYDEQLAVYCNQSPIIKFGAGFGGPGGGAGGGSGGGDNATGRPSGRGTLDDPDIPQGRVPPDPNQPSPTPDPATIPPPETRPRVVLRFAPEKDL